MTESLVAPRGVAHELNNQLTILLNSLDRMMHVHPDSNAREAVRAAEECASLAAQLLPQARVPRAGSLSSVLGNVATAIRTIQERVQIAMDVPGECSLADADA